MLKPEAIAAQFLPLAVVVLMMVDGCVSSTTPEQAGENVA